MKIIVDTREQCPYTFGHKKYLSEGIELSAGSLNIGDYSLAGLETCVAVERKSLDDLVACLGRERERFERELQRSASLDAFAIVVEAAWSDLAKHKYQSKLNPHSGCQSILAFTCRYHTPFLFAGSRSGGEYATWGFLRQYLRSAKMRWEKIIRAGESVAVTEPSAEII